MQFSNKKKAVAGALIAVGGLALVGAGTGASFTDGVTANSMLKAGTVDLQITEAPNMVISADGNRADLTSNALLTDSVQGWGGTYLKVKNTGDISLPVVVKHTETGDLGLTASTAVTGHYSGGYLAPGETATVSFYVQPGKREGIHQRRLRQDRHGQRHGLRHRVIPGAN